MKIGHGVFCWEGIERVSNRYGSFFLDKMPYKKDDVTDIFVDTKALQKLTHKRVRIQCKVINTRESGHIGDLFLGIYPTTPSSGDVVDLGVGTLKLSYADWNPNIIKIALKPEDDRDELWIDPRKLYRLHDQTVEVYIEETTDECTPPPDLDQAESGVVHTGERNEESFNVQVKHVELQSVRIKPKITKIDDGLFTIQAQDPGEAGEPVDYYIHSPLENDHD